MATYWPVISHDFVNYDDPDYVADNPHVQAGLNWEGLKWAFLNPVSCNWHPLTVLSHMLDCQLFGLKPWGHHLTNVLLHTLNTLLVLVLLRQTTGAAWRSLFVASLFAVHPLRVESVAWVAERKDLLSGCFGLLALIFYARYALGRLTAKDQESGGRGRESESNRTQHVTRLHLPSSLCYLLSFCCFALGLMSKPMLVTWPFVLLLLDYWPLRRFELSTRNSQLSTLRRLVLEKIPFLALAAATSVVTLVMQKHAGALASSESLPLGARSGNALIAYCRYLGKLFCPTELAVFYPHPGQWPLAQVLLAGGLIVGISVLFWVRRRRYPFLLVGWLWFVGTLVPVIGLVQVGGQAMADRYTYIPSLGALVLIVWGTYELARRWHYGVVGLSVAGCAAIVLCLALTRQQLGHWKNTEALFRHALQVTENNCLAHNILGATLAARGQVDEAIRQCQEALRLKPDYAEAHYNLGTALGMNGQEDEAIRQFQETIRLQPDHAEAHYNLGVALGKKGQIDQAMRQYQETVRLQPGNAAAHYNLGNALFRKGRTGEAIGHYREALRLKPDYADARTNLEAALATKADSPQLPDTSTNR